MRQATRKSSQGWIDQPFVASQQELTLGELRSGILMRDLGAVITMKVREKEQTR
jgi:hypothetical protein